MKQIEHLALLEDRISTLIKELEDMKISIKINKGWNIGIKEPKPIWETHPDWESCRTNKVRFWWDDFGLLTFVGKNKCVYPTSEAHAKRQVAEIKLMEIAEKWNEGVEFYDYYVVRLDINQDLVARETSEDLLLPYNIKFKTEELALKSIELHKELWLNYFCISE